ncbi:activated Cdc42 kinase-like isoform X3 [Macrosteles quadrilineatus]|uniref:activated Cdc42 kinase-like isoform X3 n=1 Tax=Macrosteles quadrilineatus TaxID=74068 RepID=UPI0023E1AD1F|nr:activated Cdc42 kinase-like isoform X3 [Macrosteles quadrilineatus]
MTTTKGPGLYDFLIEAELQHYFTALKNDLKVQTAAQLKFVSEEDLQQLGMSKPEMRRLKKYFHKHFPQNYISKLKKMIVYKKEENGQSLMAAMLSDEVVDKPPVKVPNKHIIPADSILVNKELGTGEFGVVQQGVWTNDGERIQVAIKCLSRERMQSNPIEFLKEAAIMHGIEHEHIVRLYGVVLDTNALMLVTELAPLRSLLECLKEPSLRFSFPVLTLCDFAIQICDGMQYLENKRLIHRDLAARNILVFSKNKVKISDFGLSRALGVGKDYYQTNFNVNLKLPIAWCAPECISYLRFTSASDVWAYGVTLWEMFSYGFQPWAALTGHQILEAIDEPNFQRLEQPDCCPKEYYTLMLKCWQHDPNKRPRFADLMVLLPDYKPEQVQAVQELGPDERVKREQLVYRVGEVITVLDKQPVAGLSNCWKGVVNSGKTGLFNPAHTVAYLGNNLPSNKPGQFTRGDGKNTYSSRRSRLRPDMISCPQGDVKHTGHVGLDGAYFGDISFLGGTKYDGIPHQVVTPYKPHEDTSVDLETRSCSDRAPLLHSASNNGLNCEWGENKLTKKLLTSDHEYHEISDEETSPDSPRFDNPFDLGPSLLDEMDAVLRCLGGPPPPPPAPPNRPPASPPPPPSPLDDTVNKRNELREMQNTLSKNKKKQATVKPISAADEKTLDSAIAMANELAARSMNDLGGGDRPPSVPASPASPTKRKFSFRFPSTAGAHAASKQHARTEGKTFTDEAASIPDIQECVTPEAQAAYNVLVEQPAQDTNPLRMLRSVPFVRPRVRGNKNFSTLPNSVSRQASDLSSRCSTLPHQTPADCNKPDTDTDDDCGSSKKEGNPVPLPPRDRNRPIATNKPRHQRKHPLIIPSTTTLARLHHPSNSSEPTYLGLEDEPTASEGREGEGESEEEEGETHLRRNIPPQEPSGFEERIACELDALDHMEAEGEGVLREHVSCEDLLEFACDGPNTRRTRGKTSGVNSDEVRIMGKVLGNKVSEDARLVALNATDWDVHRAIKLCRLDALLPTELCCDSGAKLTALCDSGWEVARAAGLLLATLQPQDDVAQV